MLCVFDATPITAPTFYNLVEKMTLNTIWLMVVICNLGCPDKRSSTLFMKYHCIFQSEYFLQVIFSLSCTTFNVVAFIFYCKQIFEVSISSQEKALSVSQKIPVSNLAQVWSSGFPEPQGETAPPNFLVSQKLFGN